MVERMRRMLGMLIGVSAALCLALLLPGCGGSAAQNAANHDDPVSAYAEKVSAATSDITLHIESFNQAAANGNVYTMRTEADSAIKTIDKLTSLTAPDQFSDVQADFVSGCNDLKDALNGYLDILTAMENATEEHPFDYSAYEEQLKAIQDKYEAGSKALQSADEKAASIEAA